MSFSYFPTGAEFLSFKGWGFDLVNNNLRHATHGLVLMTDEAEQQNLRVHATVYMINAYVYTVAPLLSSASCVCKHFAA